MKELNLQYKLKRKKQKIFGGSKIDQTGQEAYTESSEKGQPVQQTVEQVTPSAQVSLMRK